MKNDKGILLAFQFGEAPEDVRKAAERHRDVYLRLQKAETQFALWRDELNAARVDHAKSLEAYTHRLNLWNPDKKEPKREELPTGITPVEAPPTTGGGKKAGV